MLGLVVFVLCGWVILQVGILIQTSKRMRVKEETRSRFMTH